MANVAVSQAYWGPLMIGLMLWWSSKYQLSSVSLQVLCGRQIFPEEQHDSLPDWLWGGADEGGLCSTGPLIVLITRKSRSEIKRLKESMQSHNKMHYCLLSRSCTQLVHNWDSTVQNGHNDDVAKRKKNWCKWTCLYISLFLTDGCWFSTWQIIN